MAGTDRGIHMSDPPTIVHKTCTIELMSYRRKIGWVPKALVKCSSEGAGKNHALRGNPKDLLATQEAADTVAAKLAIEWIDSNFPSPTS
jgi:hypothetical protein